VEASRENYQAKSVFGTGWKRKWQYLLFPIDLYAASLVAYLLLRVFTTGRLWPVELISIVAHWLLLLAILLLPVALLARRWSTLILLSISGVAFLWLFSGLFMPKANDERMCAGKELSSRLTVMTYNISNGLASPDSLIGVIGGSRAEVVALQELPAEQVSTLREGLREVYPYQVFHGTGISGIALLSQYPIEEEHLFTLQGVHPYLRVELEIEGKPLKIIVAHPPVTFGPGVSKAPRHPDMQALARLAVEEGTTIVMGDFNFTDQNERYKILTEAGLLDTYRSAGWGFGLTYPLKNRSGAERAPLIRIDYVLVTKDICPEDAWVGADGNSDHLPVLATLRW
jgi:vancomycin resistance protein VanJ